MNSIATTSYPVLIVGAGPVGLTAACELKRHGINCRIIDQKKMPTQTSNALGVHARSLEMWAAMGIIEQAHQHGLILESLAIYNQQAKLLVQTIFKQLLNIPYPYILSVPQNQTELILNEHLVRFNSQVE